MTVLSHWAGYDAAPAAKGIEIQWPLLPYPQSTWYKGDADASFGCAHG